jgi:uncharacterized protein
MSESKFFSVQAKAVTVRVKARPGARQDGLMGVQGEELVVAVRAVAERGKANLEIARVLAGALGVPRDSVVLKLGGGSRHKVFQVPLEAAAALEKVARSS